MMHGLFAVQEHVIAARHGTDQHIVLGIIEKIVLFQTQGTGHASGLFDENLHLIHIAVFRDGGHNGLHAQTPAERGFGQPVFVFLPVDGFVGIAPHDFRGQGDKEGPALSDDRENPCADRKQGRQLSGAGRGPGEQFLKKS